MYINIKRNDIDQKKFLTESNNELHRTTKIQFWNNDIKNT